MARGPFAPVQQDPISDINLVNETGVVSAVEAGAGMFDAVAKGAEAGLQLNKEHFEKGLKDELRTDLDALEQGLAAVRDPVVQQQIFDAAARGNPFFQRAKEEFVRLSDAIKQGKLPSDSATLRAKAILSTAVADVPEFEEELRAEAKSALGFSPEAAVFRNLLREPSGATKTPEQKAAERRREQAAFLGVDEATVQAGELTLWSNKVETGRLNLQLQQGQVSSNEIISMANKEASSALLETMNMVRGMVNAGGIQNPEDVLLSVETNLNRIRENTIASFPATADVRTISMFTDNFNRRKEEVLGMIKDGSMEQLMTRHVNTMSAMIKQNMFTDPVLATVWTAAGKEGLLEWTSLIGRYNTPSKFEAALEAHPSLRGFNTIADFGKAMAGQIEAMNQGIPAATAQDRAVRGIWNGQILRSDAEHLDEKRAFEAVERMRDDLGDVSTFEQYEDGRVLANVKRSPQLRDQFANLVATNKADNESALLDAWQGGHVRDFDITIEDGQLQLPSSIQLLTANITATRDQIDQAKALRSAVQRTNNMLRIAKMYQDAGIIDFGTPEQYLSTIEQQMKGLSDLPEPEVQEEPVRIRRYNPETGSFEEVEG